MAEPAGQLLNVLIVEDSEDDALLVMRQLRRGGYVPQSRRVDSAADMEEALAQGPWDLIITDINIPGYNGIQIVRALRSNPKFQEIPIVVVTATLSDEIAESALEAGADSVHNKLEISVDLKAWCGELIQSLSKAA